MLLKLGCDFAAGHGVDGRAVDERCGLGHFLGQLVVLEHDGLHMRAVGQHRDNAVHALNRFRAAGADGRSGGLELVQRRRVAVIYAQLVSCFEQVFRHRFAHDSQTNE